MFERLALEEFFEAEAAATLSLRPGWPLIYYLAALAAKLRRDSLSAALFIFSRDDPDGNHLPPPLTSHPSRSTSSTRVQMPPSTWKNTPPLPSIALPLLAPFIEAPEFSLASATTESVERFCQKAVGDEAGLGKTGAQRRQRAPLWLALE